MKRTALNAVHKALGAKLINPAGWEMPESYADLTVEHNAIRNACGLTDFSSMGPIDVKGPDAATFLNYLTVNEVAEVPIGRVVYTTIVNEQGIILDDTTVYKMADDHYMLVTSTAKHDATFAWLKKNSEGFKVYLTDLVSAIALVCLQGPKSRQTLQKLTEYDLNGLKYFFFAEAVVAGAKVLISRTGFTGELGYELYIPSIHAVDVWEALMAAGAEFGILPVGIRACASTLRLEKAYMGGAELNEVTPLELPLSWTVRLKKDSFIGRDALLAMKQTGIPRKLVGFLYEGGTLAPGADILLTGKAVGKVTSAAYGPTVGKNIALGFVPMGLSGQGNAFDAEGADGKPVKLTVVPIPFYDFEGSRLRS